MIDFDGWPWLIWFQRSIRPSACPYCVLVCRYGAVCIILPVGWHTQLERKVKPWSEDQDVSKCHDVSSRKDDHKDTVLWKDNGFYLTGWPLPCAVNTGSHETLFWWNHFMMFDCLIFLVSLKWQCLLNAICSLLKFLFILDEQNSANQS